MNYQRIVSMVNQPWAMNEMQLSTLFNTLDNRLNGDISSLQKDLNEEKAIVGEHTMEQAWGLKQLSSDTAMMTISGTIVPRTGSMKPYCGMTPMIGASNLLHKIEIEDPNIKNLIVNISSPGGIMTAVPELAKDFRNSRLNVIGFTDEMAASAGYYLLSGCDTIVCAPSAIVGSIGVYTAVTKRVNESSNYKTHYFKAGAKKLFGATDIPLTEEEAKHFQDSVNSSYEWFTSDVAEYRGMSIDEVKSTEAATFRGINAGKLVDKVMTFNELLKHL